MKQAADDGKKRMPKYFYEKLDRLTRRSFLVNDDVKTSLAAALEAEFKVEKASGETDVYIGRVATVLDIVVSGDSDVFCYRNVKTMVRPTRHRGQYVLNVLHKSLALRKMRLNSDDLVVLAVVSGNDYVSKESFKTNGLVLPMLWIDITSKPPPPDRKVEDAINLPNIFQNKFLQSTHRDAWIIALDPGATCIVGAVAYDPNHPDQRRNLAVTTKCLAEPERRYRNWLEANKPEAICTAERECTKSDQVTWAVFLERFVISYDIARTYYSSTKYKRKRWDADKAKRGELDRVLESIVKMVGESMGHKLSGDKKVIVAMGMGDFSSAKSRHVMFTSSIKIPMLTVLIKKVAADIDTVFSNQIVGMLPLLKARVVEVVGEEGKQAIEEIEAWVDASLEDDSSSPPPPVQVFYKVNRLLPGPYRWSIVPHTSFGDGYVTMSEECLFDLLFDIPSFQKTVREVAGVGLDVRKMVARAAFMKNPSKGRLLEEVFLLPPEMLAKSKYVLDDSPRRYVRTPASRRMA
ncbi:hypothetical protein SeMB42_g06868 [Synchytrium endobioticum]|uniref:Asteroid domain-containing protein n=1 Tax=Synchytrium endobioticum TaxID=286115 RepID=A0A507CI86_9FUNG|nr:hypothetical protein SeMB42_g06868 [Synchytrium endobioticum]